MKFSSGNFDRRTIVGKRHKCDTKYGKRCEPIADLNWHGNSSCKHCNRCMTKPMGRK